VDEGHTRLALRGERVKRLLEAFFGGLAGVDRAAQALRSTPMSGRGWKWTPVSVQKRGPEQCVPEISRAIADKLG
jgi:hypothetical protein